MEKPFYFSVFFIFLIIGCLLGYIRSVNINSEFGLVMINDGVELSIINPQHLRNAKSVTIDKNDDPGINPTNDYFGVFGGICYPLRELEISNDDEIAIIIKPHPELRPDKFDLYIMCNTEAAKQAKDEFFYFPTPNGTTPAFNISIYKNGTLIEKSGVFGLHLSELENEFKALKRMKDAYDSSFVVYQG